MTFREARAALGTNSAEMAGCLAAWKNDERIPESIRERMTKIEAEDTRLRSLCLALGLAEVEA